MEIIKAIIIGIVQGLTEFLPVSSSAHLVLSEEILSFNIGGLLFEVAVHFGTLLAVVIYFREEVLNMIKAPFHLHHVFSSVKDPQRKWDKYIIFDLFIIIGTIPAVIVGLTLKDQVEKAFNSPFIALCALMITGIMLLSFRFIKEQDKTFTGGKAFFIGIAQAFAIIPGISRSGSTIMTGIWLGLNRETAAKFSFLLSVPAILGATILEGRGLLSADISSNELILISVATLASFISGYFAIAFLIDIIKKNKLDYFGYYCMAVSVIGLIILFI
ncbi:MAG: undecaprenyl-diphosphate phosphatase [Calditrichia bacterium]